MRKWIYGAIGAGIVSLIINELYFLVKAGAIFDGIIRLSGDVNQSHFIRTDLVDSSKQSVAQWILSVSSIAVTIGTIYTKSLLEDWMSCLVSGLVYGYTLGLGIIFLLANFDRFKDIHLAVGDAQYAFAGMAILVTLFEAFVIRLERKASFPQIGSIKENKPES